MGAVRPVALAVLLCSACYKDAGEFPKYDAGRPAGPRDLTINFDPYDGEGPWGNADLDWEEPRGPTPCGDARWDASCQSWHLEAPFPLHTDPNHDPAATDKGLDRTAEGYLCLANGKSSGSYWWLVGGCQDQDGFHYDTRWFRVNWDADVPPDTSLQVRAQSGDWQTIGDPGWQGVQWTKAASTSPLELMGELMPNQPIDDPFAVVHDSMVRIEVQFESQVARKTPNLRRLEVAFKCFQGD